MAEHHAQSYQIDGSSKEQSRRTFMANATLGMGGLMGLVLAVPLAVSLIPESLLSRKTGSGGVWADMPGNEFSQVSTTAPPVRITFSFKYADGYLPPAEDTQFVWGIKLTDSQEAQFKERRPDLYRAGSTVAYPAIILSYVIFSSICPHLGCRFNWDSGANRFICPCHGSQFGREGVKLAGPSPRGLDPLPFRESNGQAQVTWIQYKSDTPDRVIIAYD